MMEALAVASAISSIAGGIQAKRAADTEAAQYREEADNARTAAIQDETQRRKQLQRTLATQQAIRAGSGFELFSPTFSNIQAQTTKDAESDIETAQINFMSKQGRFLLGAEGAEASGQSKMLAGFGQAAGTGYSAFKA